MRRALVAAVVLAALVVGAALWAMRGTAPDADGPPRPEEAGAAAPETPRPRARVATPAAETTAPPPVDGRREREPPTDPTVSIEGVVAAEEDSAPIGGALVGVVASATEGSADLRTGIDGRFRVADRPADESTGLRVRAAGRATTWRVLGPKDLTNPIEIRLARGGGVRGVVRDPEGAGVAVADVYLVPADSPDLLERPETWTLDASGLRESLRTERPTAEDGAYEVEGLELDATYLAIGLREGYAESERLEVRATAAQPRASVDLVLRRPGALELTVLSAEGARVEYEFPELTSPGRPRRTLVTDAEGRAAVRDLDIGPWTVSLKTLRHAPVQRVFSVGEGETVRMELRLQAGVSVSGVLVDAAGRPRAGVRVSATGTDSAGVASESEATTEEFGGFRVEGLRPGRHRLRVVTGLFDVAEVDPPYVDAPADGLRLVATNVEPPTLSFRLLAPKGAERPTEAVVEGYQGERRLTAVEGVFSTTLAPGRGTVRIFVGGFAPVEWHGDVADADVVDLGEVVLDPGHAAHGRVVDGTGRGVPGAAVEWPFGPAGRGTLTGADGTFVLSHLAEGEHSVRVSSPDHLATWGRVHAGPRSGVATVVVSRGVVLRGVVVRRDGAGAPGASVRIRTLAQKERGRDDDEEVEEWLRTDARGRFECRLPPDRYRVQLTLGLDDPTVAEPFLDVELAAEGTVREVRIEAAE